ncbi:response regulator [Paenibacillus contaminans]|uniref:DNA-binding response regulator n=1 Tax=Paenibacillus contaminans TaxID=450362 RepID=A0A329MKF1_9BACL|nr:response regulator [Paenibacillus contaminans]RAV20122.1 DNA-binding response regulator [Paenibacillus contaminans]
MKLLIVEDEHHVRERLAEGIEWNAAQIELVDAVASGREAVTILQKEHVDIIVTDIQMPDMNGLELAGKVKEEFPRIKVIVLTGYDDFEYARESIECGVFNYLVKPVANERLLEVVMEAKTLREQELSEKHNLALLEQRWKEHLPHLQVSFYKNWLAGRYSLWDIEKRSRDLQLSLEGKQAWPIVIDMDPIPEGNDRFLANDRPLVQFSLYTLARDVFADMDCVTLQDDDGMTTAIFSAPQDEGEEWQLRVKQQVNVLLETVKDCLKLTASAGIGHPAADKQLVPWAYKQSRMALQERIILGNGMTIHFRDDVLVQDSWTAMSDLEKELEMAIETGNGPGMRELSGRIMEIGFGAGVPVTEAKEVLLRIMCLLARIVHSHGWTLRETLGEDYEDFERYNELLTREQICEWLQRMTGRISGAIARRRQSGTQITVNEMMRFIQERLHEEELSLYLVAEKLYVNYSYLSRIFKKLTGQSFSDYVLRLRMERAKELLAKGDKVYDAASQVGYRHVNYFSKAFSKYYGVKPSDMFK